MCSSGGATCGRADHAHGLQADHQSDSGWRVGVSAAALSALGHAVYGGDECAYPEDVARLFPRNAKSPNLKVEYVAPTGGLPAAMVW